MKEELESLKKENAQLNDKIKNQYVLKKDVTAFVIKELVNMKIIKPNQDPFFATKNLFKNYTKLDKAINNYEKEIKGLQRAKNKIDSPKFKSSNIENDFALPTNNLDIINNRIIDLHQSIAKIKQFKKSVEDIIDSLPDNETKVIRYFYIEKKSMPEIAELLSYDQSTCYRKLDDALNHIKVELFPGLFIDSMLS